MVVERTQYRLMTAIRRKSLKPLFAKEVAKVEMRPGEMITLNPQDARFVGTLKTVVLHEQIPNTIKYITRPYYPINSKDDTYSRLFSEEQINDPQQPWHKKISYRPDLPELE